MSRFCAFRFSCGEIYDWGDSTKLHRLAEFESRAFCRFSPIFSLLFICFLFTHGLQSYSDFWQDLGWNSILWPTGAESQKLYNQQAPFKPFLLKRLNFSLDFFPFPQLVVFPFQTINKLSKHSQHQARLSSQFQKENSFHSLNFVMRAIWNVNENYGWRKVLSNEKSLINSCAESFPGFSVSISC